MRLHLPRRLARSLTPTLTLGVFVVAGLSAPTTADAPATTVATPATSTTATPMSTTTTSEVLPATTTSTSTTTTTTLPGYSDADCPQIWMTAVEVGWPEEWLPLLDDIVWAESRCDSSVISSTYDYGWTQINWASHGSRLSQRGVSREDLLDPATNLVEALWIAQYAAEHYGCWSQPWFMSGDWC